MRARPLGDKVCTCYIHVYIYIYIYIYIDTGRGKRYVQSFARARENESTRWGEKHMAQGSGCIPYGARSFSDFSLSLSVSLSLSPSLPSSFAHGACTSSRPIYATLPLIPCMNTFMRMGTHLYISICNVYTKYTYVFLIYIFVYIHI